MQKDMSINNQANSEAPDRLRNLLVEDDKVDYMIAKKLLSQAYESNFDLHWSDSADTALNALANSEFDICLIDYRLGTTNGLELLSRMNKAGYQRIPKILLTGMESYEIDRRATEAGATDYLIKNYLKSEKLEQSNSNSLKQKKTRS